MEVAERCYGRVFLFVTSLLVLASAIGTKLSSSTTLAVLVGGVVILGLPHGALDPLVARKVFSAHRAYSTPLFYCIYIILVLSYALLWAEIPTLGLLGFLTITAFHFGSDWEQRGSAITRLAYGTTVVTLPALRHPASVGRVFSALGATHVDSLLYFSGILAIVSATAAAVAAIARLKHNRDLIELAGIVAGAAFLEPLLFFTCYFSLLHSPRHLLETAEKLDIKSFTNLCMRTAPIVLATIALSGSVYLVLPIAFWADRILTIVFVGLASLTVPHVLLESLASRFHPNPSTASTKLGCPIS